MSLRFSFGSRWIEIYIFSKLMVGAIDYLHIQYGHNSLNNLIRLMRDHNGRILFRWRKNKVKIFKAVA